MKDETVFTIPEAWINKLHVEDGRVSFEVKGKLDDLRELFALLAGKDSKFPIELVLRIPE